MSQTNKFFNPTASTKDNLDRTFSVKRIELVEEILNFLIPVMNEIHGTELPEKFWSFVLLDYVQSTVSRKQFFEKSELKRKADKLPNNGYGFLSKKEQTKAFIVSQLKNFKSKTSKRKILNSLNSSNQFNIGFPSVKAPYTPQGIKLTEYFPLHFGIPKFKPRVKIKKIAKSESDIFFKNVLLQTPKVFVEYFKSFYNSVQISNPKDKTFHVQVLNSLFLKFVLAKAQVQSSKIIWYQHGAYYGELKGHNGYYFESKFADVYRTWGWKTKESDEPYIAHRLIAFKEMYPQNSSVKKYNLILCFPDIFDQNIDYFKESMSYFFKELDLVKYPKMLARPRAMSRIQSFKHKVSFIDQKGVTLDNGLKRLYEIMPESEISIQFTVPSTNFLECIFLDYPVIGILENDQPTNVIEPFLDFFLKEGVLHLDVVSLCTHLNKTNILSWWSELITKPEYIEFKHQFTNDKLN